MTLVRNGIFYGIINAFRREGSEDLYTVRYTDGDQEDLDLEEYNFAYALWLTEEGWQAEEEDRQAEEGWWMKFDRRRKIIATLCPKNANLLKRYASTC